LFSIYKRENTYTANKGGDQSNAGLCAGNCLSKAKEEGKVAVDAVIALEFTSSLDAFPCRGDLDQNAVLVDANRLVKSDELLCLQRIELGNF